jgi:type IV secretory pathway TraG/TraD family ATPase VirD4
VSAQSTDNAKVNQPAAVFAVAALLGGAVALLWLAGQLSAVLTGHGWPPASLGDTFVPIIKNLKDAPGDPARAWPAAASALIGPPWLIFLIFGMLLALVGIVVYFGIRLALNWRRRRGLRIFRLGFASGWEVRRLVGARAVIQRGRLARPALNGPGRRVSARDVGFFLGTDYRSRAPLYSSVEDAVLVIAPPRQGKDVHFVTPFTLDAPGACVVMSTGIEAFTTTYEARSRLGKVYVFDPTRMTNWPDRLRWSPVEGCEDPDLADDRAKTFVRVGSGYATGSDGSFAVAMTAVHILRAYLHAAALHSRTIRDVLAWAADPTNPEPVDLLRRAEEARASNSGWAKQLEAATQADPDTRGARWAVVNASLSSLLDPAVLAEFSPEPGTTFDIREFASGRNTLYILSKEMGVNQLYPMLNMIFEQLVIGLRGIAARMPGGRLEPPVSFELNEAAFMIPDGALPRFMTLAARSSIALHVYLRSLSQAEDKWGKDGAAAMWDHAAVRIIAGGGGNIDDLEQVSELLGDIYRPDGTSLGRRVLTATEIRTMRFGTAVAVIRDARPVELRLVPWWKRRDGWAIAEAKAEIEARIQVYSEDTGHAGHVQSYIRSSRPA